MTTYNWPHFQYKETLLKIVDMMFATRESFSELLTTAALFDWYLMLLSSSANFNLKIRCWRTEDMQIISENHSRKMVHFEAPPAQAVPEKMDKLAQGAV